MSEKGEAYWRGKYKAQNKRYLAYRRQVRQTGAALYQVVGCLLSDTEQFGTGHGDKALDLLSWLAGSRGTKRPHDPYDLLPWDSVEQTKAWRKAFSKGMAALNRMCRKDS